MNMFKKIVCASLMSLMGMTGTSFVCAMEDDAKTAGDPLEKIVKDLQSDLLSRLGMDDKNFDPVFSMERHKGKPVVYEFYCLAIQHLLLQELCSEENIQKIFDATLQGFKDYLKILGDNADSVKSTLKGLFEDEKSSISQTIDAFLNFESFKGFCEKNKAIKVGIGYQKIFKQYNDRLEAVKEIFAKASLQLALADLKKNLKAIMDKAYKPETSKTETKRPSCWTRVAARTKRARYFMKPFVFYTAGFLTWICFDRWNAGEQVIIAKPIVKDAMMWGCVCGMAQHGYAMLRG